MSDVIRPTDEARPAWRLNNPELERDAIAFWRRLGLLPPDIAPAARAKELLHVFYVGGQVAAVSTASIEDMPFLRARIGMMRVAVDPAHRRHLLAVKAMQAGREEIERWAKETGERVHGVGAVVQSPQLMEWARTPKWPRSGLKLVGYTNQGHQIRVAWFDTTLD